MNLKFSKVLSVICVFAMLLSCFSSIVIFADTAAVEIVTAEYDVYDGELRVLAKLPEGGSSEAVVSVGGVSVGAAAADWMEQGEYMLFKKAYTPATYGICNVLVTCGSVSDSVNVRFMKSFAKAESLEENFDTLEETLMDSQTSTAVTDLFASSNITDISFTKIPNTSHDTRVHVKKGYAGRGATDSTVVFNVPKSKTSGLSDMKLTPATAPVGGVVEVSFDTYVTNYYARIGMLSKATNNKNMTYTSNIYETSWASTYYALNHQSVKYGASDRQVVANKWINIRFIHNFDEMSYEFYVDNELLDKGTFVYNSSTSTAVCGLRNIAFTIGYGGGSASNVDIAIDNVKILHTTTGAIPTAVSYNAQGSEEATAVSLTDAEIPYPVATDMTVDLSRTIGFAEGDIAVKTSAGAATGAAVSVTDDGTRSALAVDTSSLTPGEYKVVLSENVTFNSVAYGAETVIPFTVKPTLALISPAEGVSVKKGTVATIKACTPDAESVDLYINNEYVTTLTTDANECVSYNYATAGVALGTKNITLESLKTDGSEEILRGSFIVNEVKDGDLFELKDFENTSADFTEWFSCAAQNTEITDRNLTKLDYVTVGGQNALGAYYGKLSTVTGSNENIKSLQIAHIFSSANETGRIVTEFDLYDEDGNAKLAFSFYDGTYTYYPLNTVYTFSGGKVAGQDISYSGWHKVKYVLDTINQTSEMYFDGKLIGTSNEWTNTAGANFSGTVAGCKRVTLAFWSPVNTTAGEPVLGFAIDNWRVYKELPVPVVESITAGGNAAEENGVISSTDTFAVKFAGKYTYSALDSSNVSLLVNGTAVDGTTVSYDKATNTLSAKAASAVAAHSDVQIIIDGGALLYDGVTAAGADTVINLKVIDGSGLYANRSISKVGDNMVLSAKLDAATERSVTLIFATYSGNRLVNIDTEEVLLDGAKNIKLTLPAAGAGEARAFIWDNFTSLIPQIGVTGPVAAN